MDCVRVRKVIVVGSRMGRFGGQDLGISPVFVNLHCTCAF